MRLVPERCPVVMVGAWNRAIFSPQWVTSRLFPSLGAIDVELDFLAQQGLAYRTSRIALHIVASHIRVAPTAGSDEAFGEVEAAACNVLAKLPETPVAAIGINFGYDLDEEPPELARVLDSPERTAFVRGGFSLRETVAGRKIGYEDAGVLTVAMQRAESPPVRIDLNFHWDVPDAATAAHRIRGRVTKTRRFGLELLEQIYALRMQR